MQSAVDRLEPPVDPMRRRSGRVASVPIEFTPSFDSGTGSSGGGSGGLGAAPSKGFDTESVQDFAKESWNAGSAAGGGAGEEKKKGWLW